MFFIECNLHALTSCIWLLCAGAGRVARSLAQPTFISERMSKRILDAARAQQQEEDAQSAVAATGGRGNGAARYPSV